MAAVDTNPGAGEDERKKKRQRMKNVNKQILKQMEFYFGDSNLLKDRFLKKLMDQSEDKYVDLSVFLSFNKIKNLCDSVSAIRKAVEKSKMLKLSDDGLRLKRTTPIGNQEDVDDRTIYVEGLPLSVNHEWVNRTFSCYGDVMYVSLPRYRSTGDMKGFAFVEFATIEAAKKAVEKLKADDTCEPVGKFPKIGNKKIQSLTKQIRQSGLDEHCMDSKGDSRDGLTSATKAVESDKILKEEMKTDAVAPKSEEVMISPDVQSKKRKRDESESETDEDVEKKKIKTTSGRNVKSILKQVSGSESDSNRKRNHSGSESDDLTKSKKLKFVELNKELSVKEPTKKKRRKPKKKDKSATDQMRVLFKHEWLDLRKKYLKLQKSRMSALKKTLCPMMEEANMTETGDAPKSDIETKMLKKFSTENEKEVVVPKEQEPKFVFEPNLIVLVTATIPLHRKELKEQLGTDGIAYIDVQEGESRGHVRCITQKAASNIVATDVKGCHFTVLTGDEEKQYWEKMAADREKKLGQSRRGKNKRGVKKVMGKVDRVTMETTQSQKHVYFDD